jgi:monoamine oxidase
VLPGYDQLPDALLRQLPAERCTVHLSSVVERIRWRPGHVEVLARAIRDRPLLPFQARAAVVTLPLGVLRQPWGTPGAVRFEPDLPVRTHAAVQGLRSGEVTKVVLRFREAPWLGAHVGDHWAFIHSDLAIPTWWRPLPFTEPALIGWAGGPRAGRLSDLAAGKLLDVSLHCLARLFGRSRAHWERSLIGFRGLAWRDDPFARGGYCVMPVGGVAAQRALAQPVRETLYFAGEATQSEGHAGTVHGALESGERAGAELLRDHATKGR